MSRRQVLAAAVLTVTVGVGAAGGVAPAAAVGVVTPTQDAVALGRALAGDTSWVAGGAFEHLAGPGAAALVSGGVAGFPVTGEQAAMLSTGDATDITSPNTSSSTGTVLDGRVVRGNTDRDVTVLRVDLEVPATANCLVGMDFRFLSEEYPEYVGSDFNDAFVAELDRSTWTTSGGAITAPDNFAFDPTGSPITINAAGTTSMDAAQAEGTTFDGATPMLTAAVPLTPGAHSLYLSIFDQGDSVYDSAVIVDNLRLGRVGDPANDCQPGATVVDRSEYVALGDSYSSGFGVEPYVPGTHLGDEGNDCQRSELAYGPLVAAAEDLDLTFGACQGAVTRDFYSARAGGSWGEPPQLDRLGADTGLVTFSIGGNDARFADVLAECILGFELLPFNTCYQDDKVTVPVAAAMARLSGQASTPADVVPYDTLYRDVRRRAPLATAVAVGYPTFYPAEGGDRTFLPGGRCEGVKKADQRWVVEKVDELNSIVEANARKNGFLYAEPDFSGHELCGEGEEWIFPLLSAGRVHPTADGQGAMAGAVLGALEDDGFERFEVLPQQTVTYSFEVGPGSPFLSLVTGWPGSDVPLTVVSPSGEVFDRSGGGERETAPTWERLVVDSPQAGTWTARLYGADVAPAGEPVTLSVYAAPPVNTRPVAAVDVEVVGNQLVLDGSRSTDADGTVVGYDWYVSTAEQDTVLQGRRVSVPRAGAPERSITLVVTDDRGLTAFASVRALPVDVMPGSDVNPVNLRSKGVTPMALLSTPTLDATTIDPRSVVVGPGAARPVETKVKGEDVDRDGLVDQVLHVPTQGLGLTASATQLCLAGALPGEQSFTACDTVRVR